jgi:hypothetical protein
MRELADNVLNRRLYKPVGEQSEVGPGPERLYRQFGAADERRRLEQGAAKFAGLGAAWKVLLWIPEPEMRLKVAEVLVEDKGSVRLFVDRERDRGGRGAEIYADHRRLWTLRVFVHPSLCDEKHAKHVEAVLAYLGAELDVRFDRLVPDLGSEPTAWREVLAMNNIAPEADLQGISELQGDLLKRIRTTVPARADPETVETLRELEHRARAAARQLLDEHRAQAPNAKS